MQKPAYDQVTYWVLGALLIYVLSIGPVARLCEAGYLSTPFCQRLYTPLVILVRAPVIGPNIFAPALKAYFHVWDVH